jgi:endonuclease/exonuclease/phosphatase family metal-dependent hydrolase
VRALASAQIKLGMGGLHGNKGGLLARFLVDDTSLCFANCHLAAGQRRTRQRNNDAAAVVEATALDPLVNQIAGAAGSDLCVGGGDGTMFLDHEVCVLAGDLNYRIDSTPRAVVEAAVKAGQLARLLACDQLLGARKRNPGFRLRALEEKAIDFAPTYKYDVGSDVYDTSEKRRAPAWCDRVLYRGVGCARMEKYRRWEVRTSDHRPVSGVFRIRVKTVRGARRERVVRDGGKRFGEAVGRVRWDVQ